jgi:uncharacterized membrane protein
MNLQRDLNELIIANIITEETAHRIRDYYDHKKGPSVNRLFIVFGILGSVLIGLGMILIIAHHWDELPRVIQTILAFIPLIAGQLLCGFSIIRKKESITWRESSSVLLFFAVGACISLISQIYNISGNLSAFLMTWMLLCIPLVYVMNSSVTSLLYLCGITYYACETSYWSFPHVESYYYWILLLLVLPHYYLLYRNKPTSNSMIVHNWLLPVSVTIALGTVAKNMDELMFIAYFSLFGLFYLLGDAKFFTRQKLISNGYKTLGTLGTVVLLLALSFDWFWKDLRGADLRFIEMLRSPELFAAALFSIFSGLLFYRTQSFKISRNVNPIPWVFALFIAIFIIGLVTPLAIVLINLIVLATGILTIKEGARKDHLGILNFGLLIVTALVACRFFDTDLSFTLRGILFISTGTGLFVANYWMLKKRKTNEQ